MLQLSKWLRIMEMDWWSIPRRTVEYATKIEQEIAKFHNRLSSLDSGRKQNWYLKFSLVGILICSCLFTYAYVLYV